MFHLLAHYQSTISTNYTDLNAVEDSVFGIVEDGRFVYGQDLRLFAGYKKGFIMSSRLLLTTSLVITIYAMVFILDACGININIQHIEKNNKSCNFFQYLKNDFHINTMKFHPYKNWLAFGTDSGILKIYEIEKKIVIYEVNTKKDNCPRCSQITSISFSPDGKYLSFGTWGDQSYLYIWDIIDKKIKHIIKHPNGVWSITFNSDNTKVATISGSVVHMWEIKTGKNIFTYTEHNNIHYKSIVFSQNEKFLYLGKENGNVERLDVRTKKSFHVFSTEGNDIEDIISFHYMTPRIKKMARNSSSWFKT